MPIWTVSQILISMQACCVHTTHSDFLSGHKAMLIVTSCFKTNKPQHPANGINPKTGKLTLGSINNNMDLDVNLKQDNATFSGSFFARGQKKKPTGVSVMESPPAVTVSVWITSSYLILTFTQNSRSTPTSTLGSR